MNLLTSDNEIPSLPKTTETEEEPLSIKESQKFLPRNRSNNVSTRTKSYPLNIEVTTSASIPSSHRGGYSEAIIRPTYVLVFSALILSSAVYVIYRGDGSKYPKTTVSGSTGFYSLSQKHKIIKSVMGNHLLDVPENERCLVEFPSCSCRNLPPGSPQNYEDAEWMAAFKSNRRRVKIASKNKDLHFDIVFYGDSITEDWTGTRFAKRSNKYWNTTKVFKQNFEKSFDGNYDGLAVGIAGDTTSNLLWRLQNGEMPDELRSRVWWVLIGTNDFGRNSCSAKSVVAGIEAVLKEVLTRAKNNDYVVINSLLPRGKLSTIAGIKLWNELKRVNEHIQRVCTALSNKGLLVEYFDATDIFLNNGNIIEDELMGDLLHPSTLGHRLWAKEIVKFMNTTLQLNR
uniref:SGNH hydrolase-type esterase domain-containing protein n=1 Tax=Corethron hystrix TaxID=216773 RepID=A0A7S1BZ85_9STRA|mmetsp:Transcript_7729/g.16777  ORF Transcript_7729/g.16777 Transcript_7729/m.16777 type:complete len:399 (+) Transcript_7729:28-1224(+)